MCGGLHLEGYFAKILSSKSGNLLYKSNFYLLSEETVGCGLSHMIEFCFFYIWIHLLTKITKSLRAPICRNIVVVEWEWMMNEVTPGPKPWWTAFTSHMPVIKFWTRRNLPRIIDNSISKNLSIHNTKGVIEKSFYSGNRRHGPVSSSAPGSAISTKRNLNTS